MKSWKRHTTEGMELSNKENIWILGEKEKYKCFGIMEANNIKQMKMNEKI